MTVELVRIVRVAVVVVATSIAGGGCTAATSDSSSDTTENNPPLPPTTCEPGTMATASAATCAPVGTTSCAAGFEKDASGWGCSAIVPGAPCGAGMRASIGTRECIPVDDCSAPFPPPGASAVVTQGGATTLEAALEAAPFGGTVAVDTGTYDLTYVPIRAVNVVGRCASKVKLRSATKAVFLVGNGVKLDVRSVTMSAPADSAVYAIQKGHATLSKVIITDTQFAVTASRESDVKVVSSLLVGVGGAKYPVAEHAAGGAIRASKVIFEDVEVRDFSATFGAFNEGSKIEVNRSVVSYEGASKDSVLGLANVGGVLEVKESLLRAPSTGMLTAGDQTDQVGTNPGGRGGTVHVVSSELSQVGASKPSRFGIIVHHGGQAVLEETTLVHAADAGILAIGATSSVRTKASVIRVAPVGGNEHAGFHVFSGALAELEDTAVVAPVQYGTVTLGSGSRLSMTRSLVLSTAHRPTSADGRSEGVALAVSVVEGASATLTESSIVGSEQYGIHTGLGSTVFANDVLVDRTTAPESVPGGAAIIVDQTARIAALRCVIRGSADAAFVFHGGGSTVGESTITGNGLVLRIGNANLSQLAAPPAGESSDVVFYANRLRDNRAFSSSELPKAIVPPPFNTTP